MFSQYPSNDRWCSRSGFPDGQKLKTAASIVIGPLHSFPLNLKYHRLHLLLLWTLMFPWNETLSAELDCSLLNAQSWNKIKHIVVRRATVCDEWRMWWLFQNNSSQDYFLMFRNTVINSLNLCCPYIQMAMNHFITHDGFNLLFSFKKNQSRGKCNLVLYVVCCQTVGERGDVLLWNILI